MIHPSSTAASSFASHALQLLQRVQLGISPVELVYTAHERWPLRPGQTVHTRPTLRISVFDSSFNPPTLAHLVLANSPPPLSLQPAASTSPECYDAQMLLLSVRNADKVVKPGDATLVQRLEMMRLLSHDIRFAGVGTESNSESLQMSSNVAVGIINEPTFVGKSTVLLRFLRTRMVAFAYSSNGVSDRQDASCPFPFPKFTFILGSDTLVRVFSAKYYPSEQTMVQMLRKFLSPDQEDGHIVCAYRGDADTDKIFEAGHEFITSCRIAFIDIGAEERTCSSSEVRAKIAAGDGTWRRLVTDEIANYITQQRVYLSSGRE